MGGDLHQDLGAIRHSVDDRLGRRPFAVALARYIHQLQPRSDGYVIGLQGGWGSGKSSVINMLLEELLHLDMEPATKEAVFHGDTGTAMSIERLRTLAPLHHVTPYEVGTVDLGYFTQDVVNRRHAQRLASDPELAVDLYRYFRLRAALPGRGRNLTMVFQPWLVPESAELATVFLRELARTIGDRLGSDLQQALESYRLAIEQIAPIAGAAADAVAPGAGNLFRLAAGVVAGNTALPPTLEELKAQVSRALRALGERRVIVIVDDLDRLTPREAVQMVGLVKGLGGLPNLVYVLSYDEANLSRLIRSELRLDGTQFLEKIVQYKRHLPPMSSQATSQLFDSCIEGVVPPIQGKMLERVQELWGGEIRKRLLTPRDAIRLGNSFRIGWDAVGDYMDASDHLALQFLSLKDTELYEWIKDNIWKLCGLDPTMSLKSDPELFFEGVQIERFSWRSNLVSWLFPKAAEMLRNTISRGERIDRRLSAYDYRHAYFDLAKPVGLASVSEISKLIDVQSYEEYLSALFEESKISEDPVATRSNILDDLRQYYGDGTPIPAKMALAIIKNSGWLALEDSPLQSALFDESNLQRIQSILFRGLSAIKAQERGNFLLELIEAAEDTSVVASLVRTALSTGGGERPMDFDGKEAEVKSALVAKIEANATPAWIFRQVLPSSLLWFWKSQGASDRVLSLTSEAIDGEYFAYAVELAVSGVRSSGRPYYWEYVPKEQGELMDLARLERAAEANLRSSSEEARTAAERFLRALATPETGPEE